MDTQQEQVEQKNFYFEFELPVISFCLENWIVELTNWGKVEQHIWQNNEHSHSFYELCVVHAGSGVFKCHDEIFELKPGDIFGTGPGAEHTVIADSKEGLGIFCASFALIPIKKEENKKNTRRNLGPWIDQFARRQWYHAHNESLVCLGDAVCTQIHNWLPGLDAALAGLFQAMIVEVVQALSTVPVAAVKPEFRHTHNDNRISRALHYIEVNYCHRISEQEIAEELGLSKRQLNRLFKDVFDLPVMKYVQNYRFKIAKQLLDATRYSIRDVAHRCGFPNERNFMTQFKKHTGQTALDFRHTRNHEV